MLGLATLPSVVGVFLGAATLPSGCRGVAGARSVFPDGAAFPDGEVFPEGASGFGADVGAGAGLEGASPLGVPPLVVCGFWVSTMRGLGVVGLVSLAGAESPGLDWDACVAA